LDIIDDFLNILHSVPSNHCQPTSFHYVTKSLPQLGTAMSLSYGMEKLLLLIKTLNDATVDK
jgi:hypothetical protein